MFMIETLKILPKMFLSTFKSDYFPRSELWLFWSINDFCELLNYEMGEIDSLGFSLVRLVFVSFVNLIAQKHSV